ncbi:hypothetical protein ACJ73_01076 [Blastomyces percursus]|uniref:F-box domain-containing protein n=1 Tax=Blastomyces percursus TaxID=1658174 RepID=A0A1J9QHG7_9EURO|nr:hypothetical protein ACJ73_01076 [Blastomyces percursus]
MLVEYNGAFVIGTGIPSGVLRFAGHVVLGIYMSLTSTAYNYVKDHAAIVQQPPFHPNTFYLSHLASKWSKIGFWWNFAMWIPTMLVPSLYVILIGLLDAAIMVYFAIATVRQATYIPHSPGPCRNAETWQVPMNGNESYFHVLETLHTYLDNPDMNVPSDKICKDFVSQWRFGIGSLLVVSIVGVRSRMTPERKRKEPFVLSALKVICFIPYSFGEAAFQIFWSALDLLPNSVLSRCRFYVRYMSKMSQFVSLPIQDRLQKYSISFPFFKRYDSPSAPMMVRAKAKSESAPLARFLHLDILTLVAQHLHYQDLVNLSLASKEMRQTVFPDGHSGGCGLGILRIYACDNATKTGSAPAHGSTVGAVIDRLHWRVNTTAQEADSVMTVSKMNAWCVVLAKHFTFFSAWNNGMSATKSRWNDLDTASIVTILRARAARRRCRLGVRGGGFVTPVVVSARTLCIRHGASSLLSRAKSRIPLAGSDPVRGGCYPPRGYGGLYKQRKAAITCENRVSTFVYTTLDVMLINLNSWFNLRSGGTPDLTKEYVPTRRRNPETSEAQGSNAGLPTPATDRRIKAPEAFEPDDTIEEESNDSNIEYEDPVNDAMSDNAGGPSGRDSASEETPMRLEIARLQHELERMRSSGATEASASD